MFCKACGTQVADTERFCPNCGAPLAPTAPNPAQPNRPAGAPGMKSAPIDTGKTISIGSLKLSLAQLITCCAAIAGLLAFIFYFFAPYRFSAWGSSGAAGFGDLFSEGYTAIFFVIGAIFTFVAVALVAIPVVLQLVNKNDAGEFEIPAISFVLFLIGFIINIITASTIKSMLFGYGSISFWHLLYLLFSIIFLAYCVFSAFMAYKANNNKIKISVLGYTLFEQK